MQLQATIQGCPYQYHINVNINISYTLHISEMSPFQGYNHITSSLVLPSPAFTCLGSRKWKSGKLARWSENSCCILIWERRPSVPGSLGSMALQDLEYASSMLLFSCCALPAAQICCWKLQSVLACPKSSPASEELFWGSQREQVEGLASRGFGGGYAIKIWCRLWSSSPTKWVLGLTDFFLEI